MKFWTLPDDGAPVKCQDCDEYGNMSEMLLVETPDGKRRLLHEECVDSDWLDQALNMGEFQI